MNNKCLGEMWEAVERVAMKSAYGYPSRPLLILPHIFITSSSSSYLIRKCYCTSIVVLSLSLSALQKKVTITGIKPS